MDDLQALAQWVEPLIQALTPQQRKAIARTIALDLRASQARRIRAQQAPDGSAYTPRKKQRGGSATLRAKAGAIKARKDMFEKLRTAKYLRTSADPTSAAVGFLGRIARIASVHQWGEQDRPQPGGPLITYPVRPLLGITEAERDRITETLLTHLAK